MYIYIYAHYNIVFVVACLVVFVLLQNGEYLDYLKQQEEQYQERVAKRIAAAQAAAACKQEGA